MDKEANDDTKLNSAEDFPLEEVDGPEEQGGPKRYSDQVGPTVEKKRSARIELACCKDNTDDKTGQDQNRDIDRP